MALHELLAARRDEVMQRWKTMVLGRFAPESIPMLELEDHLPPFLDEIVSALRGRAGLPPDGPKPSQSRSAAEHGEQRLRLGFSVDSVVREYGALRDAIVAMAQADGLQVDGTEFQVVFDCVITGIAHAVSEYAHQRDADLMRQANEHFAFIAHELRNPLGTAHTALAVLKQRQLLPANDRMVAALERALVQTSKLIDETLQIARVASGIELHREWTTFRDLLAEVEAAVTPEAEAKNVALEVVVPREERIHIDVRLIRSALGNMLRNAVKYTESGGAVELRARTQQGRAVMEIEDSCGGLPPGKVEAAFAPFVRLDETQSGFGLGLAIARQAASAHGGDIRVQNLPGKGCIFVLEFPVQPPGAS